MTDKSVNQNSEESTGEHDQFEEEDWVKTESRNYALNLTDRDCDTAKIHVVSVRNNIYDSGQVFEALEMLTSNPDHPLSTVGFRITDENLLTLQVEQELATSEKQNWGRRVAEHLISEM